MEASIKRKDMYIYMYIHTHIAVSINWGRTTDIVRMLACSGHMKSRSYKFQAWLRQMGQSLLDSVLIETQQLAGTKPRRIWYLRLVVLLMI